MLRHLYSHPILTGHAGYWLLLAGLLGSVSMGAGRAIAESVPPQTLLISQAPPASTAGPTRPVLQAGARGADISELQATLKLLGFYDGPVDGVYTPPTVAAVSQFQQATGLAPDGIVGPATWNRLYPPAPGAPTPTLPPAAAAPTPGQPVPPSPNRPVTPPQKPAPSPVTQTPPAVASFPILRKGMKGPAVVALQERLQAVGVLQGGADGVFGDETEAAVKEAQKKYALEVDGIVGPSTWSALMR